MRLIDADKYTENIKNFADSIRIGNPKFASVYDAIINSINRQPTAYDVDNVLKQLEDESKKCSICELPTCKEDESHCCYCNGLNKAIEIVKAGGMNNNSKTSD